MNEPPDVGIVFLLLALTPLLAIAAGYFLWYADNADWLLREYRCGYRHGLVAEYRWLIEMRIRREAKQ